MHTIFSKTGIEVRYPCTIHLLGNGEIIECEYRSDNLGRDILEYVCEYQNLNVLDYWGLKYLDSGLEEQRYWLELDKLIHSQVKNICPLRFHFRVKVYPLEPYKISDDNVRHQIFQQLRLDLLSGRLKCEANDASILVGLLLQFAQGDCKQDLHYNYMNYIKENIIRRERYVTQFYLAVQARALEIYENLLCGLGKSEIKDLFLRMASKLNMYGVEPFYVQSIQRTPITLWINCNGIRAFDQNNKALHIQWRHIGEIGRKDNSLFVSLPRNKSIVFKCLSNSECNYIWNIAFDNYVYFSTIIIDAWNCESEKKLTKNDKVSWITDMISKGLAENRCCVEENPTLIDLKMTPSTMQKINVRWWLSQIPVVMILLIYVFGLNSEVVNEFPCFCSMSMNLHNVPKFLLNKLILS